MVSVIKGHLTFSELLERWSISNVDLFHLVADKKLFPSIFLTGSFDVYESNDQERRWNLISTDDFFEAHPGLIEGGSVDSLRVTEVYGYYYLGFERPNPLKLEGCYVRDECPSNEWGGRLWKFPFRIPFNCGDNQIDGSSSYVVFLAEEVERCEREKVINMVGGDIEKLDQDICAEPIDVGLTEKLQQAEGQIVNLQNELQELKNLLKNSSVVSVPIDHPMAPPELLAAIRAWKTAYEDPTVINKRKSVKNNILDILSNDPKCVDLGRLARKRISTVANWNKKGGPPKAQ